MAPAIGATITLLSLALTVLKLVNVGLQMVEERRGRA